MHQKSKDFLLSGSIVVHIFGSKAPTNKAGTFQNEWGVRASLKEQSHLFAPVLLCKEYYFVA